MLTTLSQRKEQGNQQDFPSKYRYSQRGNMQEAEQKNVRKNCSQDLQTCLMRLCLCNIIDANKVFM